MFLAQLQSSVSALAIRFYWEGRPDAPESSSLLMLFMPLGVTYIRQLTTDELQQQGIVASSMTVRYGCFAYHTYTQLARCESSDTLSAFIKQHGYCVLELDQT